jgi:hypothetical protein
MPEIRLGRISPQTGSPLASLRSQSTAPAATRRRLSRTAGRLRALRVAWTERTYGHETRALS